MKFFLPILTFFFFSFSGSYAQNYQAFRSDRTAFFQQIRGSEIQAIRFDSVASNQNMILYPFSQIEELSFDCFEPKGTHWVGQKIQIQPNGDHLFFNKFGDTILFKTTAPDNTEWIVYEPVNGFKVKGCIQGPIQETFLGVTDSVKWIRLQLLDQNDRPVDHRVNDMRVKFSKDHGIIRTLNFQLFPFYENDFFGESIYAFDLVGLSNPDLGIQNLTWMQVHDFAVGDEIHTQNTFLEWSQGQEPNSVVTKRKEQYLDKVITVNSVSYKILVEEEITQIYYGDTTFQLKKEEISKLYQPDPEFDHLPGEPVGDQFGDFYFYSMFQEEFLGKTLPAIPETFFQRDMNPDTCLIMSFADGCYDHSYYYKGLGGPYYYCWNPFGIGWEENKIIYFKKDTTEWGEPLILTNTSEVNSSSNIHVFPNPATSYIWVQTGEIRPPLQFKLFNYDGRLLQQQTISRREEKIDLSMKGLFFYQVLNEQGVLLKSGKIIAKF